MELLENTEDYELSSCIERIACSIHVIFEERGILSLYGTDRGKEMIDILRYDSYNISNNLSGGTSHFYEGSECLSVALSLRSEFEKENNLRVIPLPIPLIMIVSSVEKIDGKDLLNMIEKEGSTGISIYLSDKASKSIDILPLLSNCFHIESIGGYLVNERTKAISRKEGWINVFSKICSHCFFDTKDEGDNFIGSLGKANVLSTHRDGTTIVVIWKTLAFDMIYNLWKKGNFGVVTLRERELLISTTEKQTNIFPKRKSTRDFLLSDLSTRQATGMKGFSMKLETEGKLKGYYIKERTVLSDVVSDSNDDVGRSLPLPQEEH